MHLQKECRACLVRLVDLTVEMATEDPQLRAAAREAALHIIDREFAPGAIPAIIANHFHPEIKRITGNPDPFGAHKHDETNFWKAIFRPWRRILPMIWSLC
jgi:uncharacterized protein with ATP-grasp and redox domains